MASDIFYPAVSGDDGWCSVMFTDFESGLGYAEFPRHSSYNDATAWFRFVNVSIPQGTTITKAVVKLTAYQSKTDDPLFTNLYFNDIDNAVAPTSAAESNALAITSEVAWDNLPAWTAGTQYESPELMSILQTVVDRAGWNSGNAVMLIIRNDGTAQTLQRRVSCIEYDYEAEIAELHVEWEFPTIEGDISEDINVLSEFDDSMGELNEMPEDVSILSDFDDNIGELPEDASVNSGFISEHTAEVSEDASVNSAFTVLRHLTVSETLFSWDALKWGWKKLISDSMTVTDKAEKILGILVSEWLTLIDAQANTWDGTETISDSFYAVDISIAVKIYTDLIADGMAVVDAVHLALELILIDILTCTDSIVDIGKFQHLISDSLTLADIVQRFFPKTISDSMAIADVSLFDILAILQISETLVLTEITTPGLTINQTIADALKAADTVTLQQFLQEIITDGLNIEILVEIDDEFWECWVLNTAAFHPSVYSGYGYNSFAEFNNTVYGCKSDGIYELTGDNDNGTDFHSGVIFPETQFESANNKRFRRAFFGVSGDNLVLKAETDSGYRTFRMVDTEVSITHDLKGRKWTFSVEDFDSLDMIELIPIILSRK